MSLEQRLAIERQLHKALRKASEFGPRRLLIKQRNTSELLRLEAEAEVVRLNKKIAELKGEKS